MAKQRKRVYCWDCIHGERFGFHQVVNQVQCMRTDLNRFVVKWPRESCEHAKPREPKQ